VAYISFFINLMVNIPIPILSGYVPVHHCDENFDKSINIVQYRKINKHYL
jgi:hypothetical protein